jgi:hypothetical protein
MWFKINWENFPKKFYNTNFLVPKKKILKFKKKKIFLWLDENVKPSWDEKETNDQSWPSNVTLHNGPTNIWKGTYDFLLSQFWISPNLAKYTLWTIATWATSQK